MCYRLSGKQKVRNAAPFVAQAPSPAIQWLIPDERLQAGRLRYRWLLFGADAGFPDELAETREIGLDQRGEFLACAADEIEAE